jgi:hypothetical protein
MNLKTETVVPSTLPDKNKSTYCGMSLTVTFRTGTVSETPRKRTTTISSSGRVVEISTQLLKSISDWDPWEHRVV